MKAWTLIFLLPLTAVAQSLPPGYTCTHFNEYYAGGVPPPGQPNECEAVGSHATDNSFTYFFPLTGNADPPAVAAPEIDSRGSVVSFTLLLGVIASLVGRRRKIRSCDTASAQS